MHCAIHLAVFSIAASLWRSVSSFLAAWSFYNCRALAASPKALVTVWSLKHCFASILFASVVVSFDQIALLTVNSHSKTFSTTLCATSAILLRSSLSGVDTNCNPLAFTLIKTKASKDHRISFCFSTLNSSDSCSLYTWGRWPSHTIAGNVASIFVYTAAGHNSMGTPIHCLENTLSML